jgi:hypothetical protein
VKTTPTLVGLAISLGGVALLASPAHRWLGPPELLRTRVLDQLALRLLFAAVHRPLWGSGPGASS